jgi:hypothetical protein
VNLAINLRRGSNVVACVELTYNVPVFRTSTQATKYQMAVPPYNLALFISLNSDRTVIISTAHKDAPRYQTVFDATYCVLVVL